ncbi:hypothetical protein ADK67_18315 [Saccharothrix sp. NRRL B-16348]|uniref:hypothetical protein n=1 Tax=Saccharothrix sp. NRRL B-16348 TaxID=1415542 RepID=UPI0006AEFC66|nr:hypothetical protein [Saccharothrix sp. NRRL B-16348]KOX24533.1 hypothetical protein ADK67_18315 [Saccharothrix sp. NRRL B-16348]
MDTLDEELAALRRESDRVAESLLAMEDHPGHRLLRGAVLTGASARRWEAANAGMVRLWEWFDAYRAVLRRASDTRDPAELGRLLRGEAVVLPGASARTLTGPVAERVTVRALVARMKSEYARVTAVLAEAHEAWARRLEVLDPLAGQVAGIDSPAAERLHAEVARAHARAVADPLTPDPAVADLVARVAAVSALHRTFSSRVAALSRLVAEVESVRARAAEVRVEVVAKIVGDHPPVPTEDVAGALDGLRGRFPDVAESDVAAVETAVGAAAARAREVLAHLTGSLDRRAELRGRLDAYRAKAAGRGFAEDAELLVLHRQARDVLFGAPCDLGAGTVAVLRYQRAVLARTEAR